MIWLPALALLLQVADAARLLETEKYAEAAPMLEKALEADPKDFRVRFNLAFAYSHLQRDREAIEHYTKVVEEQPDLVPARLNLGMLLLRQKQPALAVPHLEAAAEKKPQDFRAQFYLGEALLGAGRSEHAVAAYRRAAEIDARSEAASLGLGRSLARSGQIETAREHFRKAGALLELADMLEQAKQPAQALDLYLEFLQTKPDALAVRERAGVLLLQQKRYPEAIEHLEAAVKQNPTAANQAALAQGYTMAAQPAKALPVLRAALAAEPSSADLRFRLGTALLESSDFDGAAREFLMVVAKQPDNQAAFNGLGFAFYKKENHEAAMKALDRARQLGPEPPGNHYLRGIILDTFHQYPAALENYQRFLNAAAGRYPDDEFKARQRIRIITTLLNKRR